LLILNSVTKGTELEFLKSLWGLGTEEEEGYRTGPPGYIGWRNSFLGIDSGAPYTFKNTGSVDCTDVLPVCTILSVYLPSMVILSALRISMGFLCFPPRKI
jgi:hypothetical protein